MPRKHSLKSFNQEVARLRNKTGMSYQRAQKQVSREYKQGKVSGVKKHHRKTKKAHHKARGKSVSGSGVVTIGYKARGRNARHAKVAGLSKKLEGTRDAVHEQLGWLLAAQRTAKTKKEKKGLQPKINELTKVLKALEGSR